MISALFLSSQIKSSSLHSKDFAHSPPRTCCGLLLTHSQVSPWAVSLLLLRNNNKVAIFIEHPWTWQAQSIPLPVSQLIFTKTLRLVLLFSLRNSEPEAHWVLRVSLQDPTAVDRIAGYLIPKLCS